MGRGIGRAEMHGMTTLDQTEGDGCSYSRLTDAALTHDHDQAPSICRQKVNQPI
jgi:hypothetical protein